ncbi:hypothetical protein [Streptomyces canus]|uniref:hypothetical protein n=1 Tax=Streptomyces canus TaxID=58343 RepID=UPI002E255B00
MASVRGMLEERETAARVRVEGLREEAARLAEVLEAAEMGLDQRVIAREELVEALAASVAETTAGTQAEEKAVLSLAPAPGLDGAALAGRAAGDGSGAGPSAHSGRVGTAAIHGSRTVPRSRSWNSAISPCSRQRRKKV